METLRHLLSLLEFQPGWGNTLGGLGLLTFTFMIYELWRYSMMAERPGSRHTHVIVTVMLVFPSIVITGIMICANVRNGSPWRNLLIALAAVGLRNVSALLPKLVRRDFEGMPVGFSSIFVLLMISITVVWWLVP